MSAPPRLLHLLELADKGPALRAALAEEVAELLVDWPADCPEEMRAPCEALLAQAAREVDSYTRARLRVRLYADPQLAQRLLPRETNRDLMEWVRSGDIQGALADTAGLSPAKVAEILADDSGQALAVACKGSGIDRATYSAIAMLAKGAGAVENAYEKLDMFDNVPTREAVRQLRAWRMETIRAAG